MYLARSARYDLFAVAIAAVFVALSATCAAFSTVSAVVAAFSADVALAASDARAALSAASAAFNEAICALSAVIVPLRSVTENVPVAAFTAVGRPVEVAAIEVSVATTVTVPAVTGASVEVTEPITVTGVTPAAEAVAEVVTVLVTDKSAKVAPISVTEIASDATGLPNTSVAVAVIVGAVPIAADVGSERETFAATPAVPLMYTIVEYAPFVMVTEPTVVLVVYAYTVDATPVDVTEIDDTPEVDDTGARVVLSAETSLTPDATNETTVPVSAVAASATVFDESITFDVGTATVAGAADVVVFADPATVTASGVA